VATKKTAARKPASPRRAVSLPPQPETQPDPAATLGVRLKHARMVKQLTLKALAAEAGCSESMLSKLEGGHAQPSLATLHKIALALSTNVGALVSGPDINTSPVQRANERPTTEFPSAGKRLSIMLERVIVPSAGQLLQSDIHVIEPLASSDECYLLQAGDTFYFPSTVPHSYRNPGKTVARVLWTNTPPTF
jgi:transcriptional regulator with XRE-family HTH domain